MEILSTGEKIKRARIYKGITLKDLCEDKISISKMSCIENGKVKADKEIIKFIAEKIDLDYEYLIATKEDIPLDIESVHFDVTYIYIFYKLLFEENIENPVEFIN